MVKFVNVNENNCQNTKIE